MEQGIREVGANMEKLIRVFPKETEKFMKNEAKSLRKNMISLAKSRVKKLTGNYLKGFKAGKKVYKWSDAEFNIRVFNSSRHGHLIEYGHRGIFWGKSVGWVPGKHVMEDSLKQYDFENHVENELADFITKELER